MAKKKSTPRRRIGGVITPYTVGAVARTAVRAARAARTLFRTTPRRKTRSGSTRKKSIFHKGKPDGMGGTYSFIKLTSKKKKIIKNISKILPKSVFSVTSSGRITCGNGVQGVGLPLQVCGGVDLSNIMATAGASGSDTTLMNLTGASANIAFTNQDKGNCELHIYDIIARKDQAIGVGYNPTYTFNAGLQQANTSGSATTVASSNLGAMPFSSQMFCQYWKIQKVTRVIMGQGTCHIHRFKYSLARKLDNSFIVDTTTIGGLTYYAMVVIKGLPYNDITTKANVASGTCAVDFVADLKYNYNFIEANQQHIQYYNGQATIIAESVMDVGSGEAEADAQA